MCYTPRVIGDGVFSRQGSGFVLACRFPLRECRMIVELFAPVSLMTFIYKLAPYSMEIYRMCKYELSTSRLSKVVIRQTYIYTNGQ